MQSLVHRAEENRRGAEALTPAVLVIAGRRRRPPPVRPVARGSGSSATKPGVILDLEDALLATAAAASPVGVPVVLVPVGLARGRRQPSGPEVE